MLKQGHQRELMMSGGGGGGGVGVYHLLVSQPQGCQQLCVYRVEKSVRVATYVREHHLGCDANHW